jgi:hypothetical protein
VQDPVLAALTDGADLALYSAKELADLAAKLQPDPRILYPAYFPSGAQVPCSMPCAAAQCVLTVAC